MMRHKLVSLALVLGLAACSKSPEDAGVPVAKGPDSLVPIGDVQQLPPGTTVTTTSTTTATTTTPPKVTPTKPPVTKPVETKPVPTVPAPKPQQTGASLAIGTKVSTTMIDSVHSRYTKVGDAVRARVTGDVLGTNGRVVIPAGSVVTMHVTAIGQADSRGEKGTLELAATAVDFGGTSHTMKATATDYQFEMHSRGVGSSEVAKTGAGAVAGAILGRVIGGKKGTIVGAVGGGAVGAAVASNSANRDIVVHAGTPMTLTLGDEFGVK